MIISNMGDMTIIGSPERIGGELLHAIDAIIQTEEDKHINIIYETVRCAKEIDNLSVLEKFANRVSEEL